MAADRRLKPGDQPRKDVTIAAPSASATSALEDARAKLIAWIPGARRVREYAFEHDDSEAAPIRGNNALRDYFRLSADLIAAAMVAYDLSSEDALDWLNADPGCAEAVAEYARVIQTLERIAREKPKTVAREADGLPFVRGAVSTGLQHAAAGRHVAGRQAARELRVPRRQVRNTARHRRGGGRPPGRSTSGSSSADASESSDSDGSEPARGRPLDGVDIDIWQHALIVARVMLDHLNRRAA